MNEYEVQFTYNLPEYGSMIMTIDPDLKPEDQEAFAIMQIKEVFDDIVDLEITKIEKV